MDGLMFEEPMEKVLQTAHLMLRSGREADVKLQALIRASVVSQ